MREGRVCPHRLPVCPCFPCGNCYLSLVAFNAGSNRGIPFLEQLLPEVHSSHLCYDSSLGTGHSLGGHLCPQGGHKTGGKRSLANHSPIRRRLALRMPRREKSMSWSMKKVTSRFAACTFTQLWESLSSPHAVHMWSEKVFRWLDRGRAQQTNPRASHRRSRT